MKWHRQARGAAAASYLVAGLGAPVKKTVDVLTPKGFLSVVRSLSASLDDVVAHPEAASARRFFDALEADWPNLSAAERAAHVRAAEQAIVQSATEVAPGVQRVLFENMQRIVMDTQRHAVDRYELAIRPSLSQVDQTVIDHAVSSQALFVTDEYGARAAALGNRARAIVAAGLEDGLDQYAIGETLAAQLGSQLAGRSSSYWNVVASIFSARARSYGELSAFDEAGIESFEFDAVLDEVTSVVCRFMHGRVFSVRQARQRFAEVAAGPPEGVRELQPFLGVAKDEEGNESIYFKRGEERVGVARILENAEGSRDKVGKFGDAMSNGALEAAGVSVPPLHGHCRSTLIPV